MRYGYGGHMDGGVWVVMALTTIAFWVVLGALVVWALRSDTVRGPRRDTSESPAALLARRFARGEIDAEEYAARLRVLEDHGH